VDLSALIFVALAAAWAVYLVPKALKQHEDAAASRTVESFSDRLRVLSPTARAAAAVRDEEPTADRTSAPKAKPEPAEPAAEQEDEQEDEYVLEPVRLTPLQLRLRRAAAKAAARRRRRVLTTLVLLLAVVAGLGLAGRISDAWIAAPVALIAAWLVACRLMVRKEAAARTRVVKKRRTTLADQAIAAEDSAAQDETDEATATAPEGDGTEQIPAVGVASPSTWEPVPMTLPTYVGKAQASRTVRTIDLDSTGVWSSGRNADDSELAREADTSRRSEREASRDEREQQRRASGS